MKKIRAYYPNPNGTNDLEILNENNEFIDSIPEGTFGIMDIHRETGKIIPLKRVLENIAVSPVEDGSSTLDVLAEHFPSVARSWKK